MNSEEKRRVHWSRIVFFLMGVSLGTWLLYQTLGRSLIEGAEVSISSFVITHFLGYLFFIPSPVEALFVHMVSTRNSVELIILSLLSALLAQWIDYKIGHSVSGRVITHIIGERKYKRYKSRIHNHGGWTIFLFNLFPLSSPVIMLIAGMLRYKFKKAIFYSASGLIIKYTVLVLLFVN